jgi:hypothetical protein
LPTPVGPNTEAADRRRDSGPHASGADGLEIAEMAFLADPAVQLRLHAQRRRLVLIDRRRDAGRGRPRRSRPCRRRSSGCSTTSNFADQAGGLPSCDFLLAVELRLLEIFLETALSICSTATRMLLLISPNSSL